MLTLGSRQVVMVFDPDTDDVHLLRCVVQLLPPAAAVATLDRIGKIRKCSGQIKASASTIDVEAETLLTELTPLLAQARTALAVAVAEGHEDAA